MSAVKKIEEKKELKRKRIVEAALELYLMPNSVEPSVDRITKKARVAKGTFYLYFPDKSKLEEQLVVILANKLITDAVNKVDTMDDLEPVDRVIKFTDTIIDYFYERRALLNFVQKKLSWGFYRQISSDDVIFREAKAGIDLLCSRFIDEFGSKTFSKQELVQVILIIIEMVNGVTYNSIMNNGPVGIDEIKPTLNKCIRGILNQ